MARSRKPANIVAPQLRRWRRVRGWTQEELAAECQLMGWDVSRGTISQIEAAIRCVADDEVMRLAQVLGAPIADLFPEVSPRRRRPGSGS